MINKNFVMPVVIGFGIVGLATFVLVGAAMISPIAMFIVLAGILLSVLAGAISFIVYVAFFSEP